MTEAELDAYKQRRARECAIADGYGPNSVLSMTALEPKPNKLMVVPGKRPSAVVIGLCQLRGIPLPSAEVEFHPLRKWKFDLAWGKEQIALEIEGGIWRKGGGAHSHPLNIERDIAKYNAATLLGWRILRCAPEDLPDGISNVALLMTT